MIMEEKLVNLLKEKNYHIAFAESCTGGLCASSIVSVASASSVLDESIVTYSNESKVKFLNVNPLTIEKYGVVSLEVVHEMAEGICASAGSEVGVGISGIAGPSGGTKDKPVGTVCFGIKIKDKVYTYRECFSSLSRNEVRNASVKFVFNKLIELLSNN